MSLARQCIDTNVRKQQWSTVALSFNSKLDVVISLADPFDIYIKAKVSLRGSCKQDEKLEEWVSIFRDIRYVDAGSVKVAPTSNQLKGMNVKGAAQHNPRGVIRITQDNG